ncbi:hypothetical protein FOQG_17687 [Fusarium oxysporum f. sp. raphani 54005]|uniref:PNPLA domain-containing protein n=2 Tax=Fusarium oxysporum f. sp. raphani TaxID=96318 RepID=X0C4C5_FUSOX|nr:hypothetical protein FOQG_17687 [Fusarium oxysporum f. sp. raphani 54005]KAG7413363.1 85/88 kDa calcium-independent phospholipase A2 [Fusarium oxysporum f. sp. raphani]
MDAVSVLGDSGYEADLEKMLEDLGPLTDGEKMESERLKNPTNSMLSWPQPSEDFVAEKAEKARIPLFCRICAEKGAPADFVLCSGCGAACRPAHKRCLASSPSHQPNDELTMYGDPCEEIDFQEYIFTSWLLDSRFLDKDKTSLHVDDLWSTWFGVPHDQEGSYPQLCIHPRLERLIDNVTDRPARQYPSLISFVGDTGSGKSTLIRAIIRMLAPRSQKQYRVPVQGAAEDGFESTSSDVHLFADPHTSSTEVPRLFVDCEGFSGTDTPVSRQLILDARKSPVSQTMRDGTLRHTPVPARQAVDPVLEHASSASNRIDLKWGRILAPIDTPRVYGRKVLGQVDPKSRSTVVKTLYPRLLYAFSDVVCFVTNNSRASQDILEQMFRWAKDGHEKTLNQRVRPGLIIILNKMPADSHDVLSSVKKATRQLLDSFQKSTRFQELQRKWKARGRAIRTAEELILCYYESFRVISIPQHTPSSPTVVKSTSDQVKALYYEIVAMSEEIRGKRQSLNLDLDVSSLNAYLLRSASALARDFHNSLDFRELSDGDSALPRRFSEHLAQLMSRMAKLRHFDTSQAVGGETELVLQMTPYIAACIIAQIDQANDEEQVQKPKEALVDEARRGLEQFRNQSWRCEAKDSSGQRRCKNYLEGHDKGHQFDARAYDSRLSDVSDENLEVGLYQSSYDPDCFIDQLWEELSSIRNRAQATEKLASAATACGVTGVTTQRTCLSCLSNTPTNMLPCIPQQHGVCEDCIKRYNPITGEESLIRMSSCPLGCSLTNAPWTIRVKPQTAGARILALDGGGIRGIVEIVILAEIEEAVGLGIRIQELFDLVIGTSTGGLVALGVFERNWTLSEAENHFRELSREAFSIRKALAVPILSKIAEPFCDFKYKSSGINKALQRGFGNDNFLFGQTKGRHRLGDQVKVGVVACLEGRYQPCLIANYSRNPPDKLKDGREGYDCLQREDEQANDFLSWQAARATSAAPTLFKPYNHQPTQRTYVDGAIVRNNPVRLAYEEGTRIWKSTKPPDIILSIGTGILVDKDGLLISRKSSHLGNLKTLLPKGIRKKLETGIDMAQATLDCHREWVDFSGPLRGRLSQNCHRLDIGLTTKPPALDEVDDMQFLRWKSKSYLQSESGSSPNYFQPQYPSPRAHISVIAHRLLATLFYLSDNLPRSMHAGSIPSTLHCRLSPHSEGVPALIGNMNRPSFRIREVNDSGEEVVRPVRFLGTERFDQKTMSAQVELDISDGSYDRFIEVQFPRRGKHWDAIGGF